MKNKILFIGATHGDEDIGVLALSKLGTDSPNTNWIIGNERAFLAGTRYTETDLNRSAPGDLTSEIYEVKRAAEIVLLSGRYDYTIDIHGTTEDTGIFIIITNPKPENWILAANLPIDKVVYWPSFSTELSGPISEYVRCGLEIECGSKSDTQTLEQLTDILDISIQRLQSGHISRQSAKEELRTRNIYCVTESLRVDDYSDQPLVEFQPFILSGRNVYPLLIDTYAESYGIKCYLMEKIESPL
jgi:succinylglutamate desuccinylase